MNFFFFVGLFLSIKYSEGKLNTEESNDAFNYPTRLTDAKRINISDLNYCGDCCDDLNDVEYKQIVETRLDLNYFNSVEELKKRETDVYKDIKTCVYHRPLVSCVDLCLCKNKTCIYQHINRARTLIKALNCTKKELKSQPKWKNKQITLSDLEKSNLGLERCWFGLSKDEMYLIKLKLVDKPSVNVEDDQLPSDQSYEQNTIEESNSPSPITTSDNNSHSKLSSLPMQELIIVTLVIILKSINYLI